MTPDGVGEALARARGFVEARGGELARLRLAVLLGAAPAARLPGAVGWRPESGVAGALAALAALDGPHGLRGSEVERAVAWLADAQGADGGWSAASEPARVVVTGLLAGFLAKTSCARPAQLERAGAFLASSWGPERVQSGDFGVLAGYAHFFANRPHELSDAALQWCGRELERGVRSGRLRAWQAGRVLALCDTRSLPGSRLAASEVVGSMLGEQQPDGGWLPSSADPAARVAVTVDAAGALVRLGAPAPRR
jgi:hypothetical protein